MAIYTPLHPAPLQFMDGNGDPLSGATLEFYLSGTTTPTNLFSDSSGTSIGTSIDLNSSGYPESGGNIITLFRDTSIDYKIVAKTSGGTTIWTADTLTSVLDVLATTNNGEGASLVGVEDSSGNFSGTDVEAVLAELQTTATTSATTSSEGVVELATDAETQAGTDTERAVTPAGLDSRDASTSTTGLVELATSAETIAGSDATRAVTPDGLGDMLFSIRIDNDGSPTVLSSSDSASGWTVAADGATSGQIEVTHNLGLSSINDLIVTATATHEGSQNTTGSNALNVEVQSEGTNGFTVAVTTLGGSNVNVGAVNVIAYRVA